MTIAGLSDAPDGRARFLNVAMLIMGYGFGQGSIFLAQTWLLAHGDLELLALFGTHFTFAMLGIILVDAGALTILARHAASLDRGEESIASIRRTFSETSVFRGALAVLVVAGGLVAATLAASPFTATYALFAAPAFALWAVNAAGLLDGLRLSGVSGISGSLAYAASALALVFAPGLEPSAAGALLGGAFSVGYLLTVLVQFVALRANGWSMRLVRPSRDGIVAAGRDGLAMMGAQLPGQLYFRIQVLLCSAWLGAAATALLIYVKQIIVAAVQLTGFVRRVEFPGLVRKLQHATTALDATIWREQLRGTMLAACLTVCFAVAGIAAASLFGGLVADVGSLLVAYSLVVSVTTIFVGYTQGLSALGRFQSVFVWSVLANVVGVAASVALVPVIGLYGLAFADVLSSAFGIVAVIRLLRRGR